MILDLGVDVSFGQARHEMLSRNLAEIEFQIQMALRFKMTPEKIISDITQLYEPRTQAKYLDSDTFKYISSFPEQSAVRVLFTPRLP